MHVLDESHILLFLLQVSVLLALARTLGAVAKRLDMPAITGEIMAGIVLGPTIFGRIAPEIQTKLFPIEVIQNTMLETVSWLGVFFLLLASGFHVNVRQAFKSGYAAISIGIIGVLVPIFIGVLAFSQIDSSYYGKAANATTFTLFLAVACSITAISVVARALSDLKLSRSHEGSLAMSACAVNDLFGWLLFTVVMSISTQEHMQSDKLATTFLATLGFIAACLLVGTPIISFAARIVKRTGFTQAMGLQTLIMSIGLLCGAITQWLGIHAILGFFLAGTMVGSSSAVDEKMQISFSNTMHAVFVPLFFATIGLNIDFVTGMEIGITLLFFTVALFGKFIGAWIGARLGKLDNSRSILMGFVFTPGGAMEIVVGALALELKLIDQRVFVAIVFAALLSSILAGPAIGWWSKKVNLAHEPNQI